MAPILVVGAGVTGCYTATRLLDNGADVSLLARGEKAHRLAQEGIVLRDGLTGRERRVRILVVTEPVERSYDIAVVAVQDVHREETEELVSRLPGSPIAWFLGNTVRGYERAARLIGRDRVISGFPDVGGTWEGEVLLYADRMRPEEPPFNRLIAGAPYPEGASSLEQLRARMTELSQRVTLYEPIMAWHLCHVALILPLAAVAYAHEGDLEAAAADRHLLKQAMRAVVQGLDLVKKRGYPILPGRLRLFRFFPAGPGAAKTAKMLRSPFGRIALGGHAAAARAEMSHLAEGLLALGPGRGAAELRSLLSLI